MNNHSQKIDIYLISLLLEIYILVTVFTLYKNDGIKLLNIIMLSITFFTGIVTYLGGIILGLILSSIVIFVYATYLFYINLINEIEMGFFYYLWMIAIPIVTLTIGELRNNLFIIQEDNRKLLENYENLVTINEETGLSNIKSFYRDLDKEISKAKRHNAPCTLLLMKLPYYKEIRKIIGDDNTKKLIRDISTLIISSTRNEDERYIIENDTLAIIMPNTNLNGSEVVKNRIKEGIIELNLKLKDEKEAVNIDTKISILQYNEKIKNALEFKILAEEELQYDV